MRLPQAEKGKVYTVKGVKGDKEINTFLFSLGCFEGEKISILKKMYSNYIVNIRGERYGIDKDLAESIEVM